MNFKLLIQYDGTDFHGWQVQEDLRTVQGVLRKALSLVDGREVVLHGSGRTDAGVHAEGQVASVELQRDITAEKLRNAINGNLDRDVRILSVETVPDDFHARYSALSKTYVYRVVQGPVLSPFWSRFAHHDARPLDLKTMRACAQLFVGEHDWTAFSSAQSEADSRVRTIAHLDVESRWDQRGLCQLIEFTVTANGFLRYMVRSIVGTLLATGRHEIEADTVHRAIAGGNRNLVGATAAACGLTLLRVTY
jgi:tRNA pseudouridine38-40 synthase